MYKFKIYTHLDHLAVSCLLKRHHVKDAVTLFGANVLHNFVLDFARRNDRFCFYVGVRL